MIRNFKFVALATTGLVLASTIGVMAEHVERPLAVHTVETAAPPAAATDADNQRHLVRVVDVTSTPCAAPTQAVDPTASENERLALLAHRARLEAELAGRTTIILPEELQKIETTEPVQRAFREEAVAMQAHLTQVGEQIEDVQQSIELMKREAEIIASKDTMMQRQASLIQEQLDNVDNLLKHGSATVSQKLALEQTLAQYESGHLDLQLSGLKSRQELLKAQQSIADARVQLRNQDIVELGQTQARLTDLSRTDHGAEKSKAAGATCDQAPGPVFEIVRSKDGGMQVMPVAPLPAIKPEQETSNKKADNS